MIKGKVLIPVYMQRERPHLCVDCNMCVKRPESDIPFGSKETHYCLLLQKPLSGRVTHTEDIKCRTRCKPNEYKKMYNQESGEFPVSLETILHYHIEESKLPL